MTRYQYSKKIGEDIILVEGTDIAWEDFMLDVEKVKSTFKAQTAYTPPVQTPVAPVLPTAPPVICTICGIKMEEKSGVSKAGKPYRILRCPQYPELQVNKKGMVGHSIWV